MRDDYTGDSWSVPVEDMQRKERENFLHALAGRVRARGAQKLVKITHARVPIIKFEDHMTGVEVDVAIDSIGAQFKSVAMGIVASMDWRVGALVRLIKLWARHHNLNDSSTGTFNSFALTLLVIFHCQTRSPAILPPLAELFGCDSSVVVSGGDEDPEERPMHDHRRPNLMRLHDMQQEVTMRAAAAAIRKQSQKNQESLLELLSSFFAMFQGLMQGWCGCDEALSRVLGRVRVDTWHGCLKYSPWTDKKDGTYHCSIEDPFDSTDNVGRTIRDIGCIKRILEVLDVAVQNCTASVLGYNDGLQRLFGEKVLADGYLSDKKLIELRKLDEDRSNPVLPTELWIPRSLVAYVLAKQPFVEPEKNGLRGGGSSQLRPEVFSSGAVLEFPSLTLQGEVPFVLSNSSGTAGGVDSPLISQPMDVDGDGDTEEEEEEEEEGRDNESLAGGALHWDGLQILLKETNAVLDVEAANEAVKEAERAVHRAARKEAKQRKEKARTLAIEANNGGGGNNGGEKEKNVVVEMPRNGQGRGAGSAGAAAGAGEQQQSAKRPNRKERRRKERGRGGNGKGGDTVSTSGSTAHDGSKRNGRKPLPRSVVPIVVPRPPPPPGL
jgi:hypothetical protein